MSNMMSKMGFELFLNVCNLSIVNKSCFCRNAVISKNCIISGVVAAHRRLVYFEAGLCELTFSKVLHKRKQVQKLYAKNTDEKPVKMTKKLGFLGFAGAESATPEGFFKFPIEHRKRLFSKKSSSKSEHWQKRNLRSKFKNRSF